MDLLGDAGVGGNGGAQQINTLLRREEQLLVMRMVTLCEIAPCQE